MLSVSVCIDVPDLDHATRFYCEALGCLLKEQKESHNTLTAAGTTIHLSLKEEGSNAAVGSVSRRNYGRHWTPVHLDFYVEDIESVSRAVERLGGTVEASKTGDWGSAAFCADAYGNGFCLIAMRTESENG